MGADHTWAYTLDALRAPIKKGQKRWEWRREAPIRPVVFRDPGTLDDEVVHLHLEHRVVQRLLGRFLAQGFLHDELTRACVVRTDDPVPRVVALGRLSLHGDGASRLHDEVLAVAAEWHDPATRGRGKLKPVGEGVKDETLGLLDEALVQPRLREVPDRIRRRLQGHAVQDVDELHAHLERRAEMLSRRAARALETRGAQEAREMTRILEAQRDRIKKQHEKAGRRHPAAHPRLLQARRAAGSPPTRSTGRPAFRRWRTRSGTNLFASVPDTRSGRAVWSPWGWSTCGRYRARAT